MFVVRSVDKDPFVKVFLEYLMNSKHSQPTLE